MYEPPPGYQTVIKTRARTECGESRLVLVAAGISADTTHRDGWWFLVVADRDLENAVAELDAYRQENADQSNSRPTRTSLYAGAASGVFVYAGTITLVAFLSALSVFDIEWLPAGRMQAGQVTAGQWWRTITALTLHLDLVHLISNLAFGGVFGFLAGRILGGGVAWLAIVLAGALGNFINALVQAPDHSSIGASTAVFAALGVMVAHALRPRLSVQEKLLKRWSPLICGVVLLAFTGVGGERTDVAAHVTGFLAGLLIGWVGCRLPHRFLASGNVQVGAGVAAITIVTAAWAIALFVASGSE
jgi:membrane associated rhomboid family serine protease